MAGCYRQIHSAPGVLVAQEHYLGRAQHLSTNSGQGHFAGGSAHPPTSALASAASAVLR